MRVATIITSLLIGAALAPALALGVTTGGGGNSGGSAPSGGTGPAIWVWDVNRPLSIDWRTNATKTGACADLFRAQVSSTSRAFSIKDVSRDALQSCANHIAGGSGRTQVFAGKVPAGKRANDAGVGGAFGPAAFSWTSTRSDCRDLPGGCTYKDFHPTKPGGGGAQVGHGVAIAHNVVFFRYDPFRAANSGSAIFSRRMPAFRRDRAVSQNEWWQGETGRWWNSADDEAGPLGPFPPGADVRTDGNSKAKTTQACADRWNQFTSSQAIGEIYGSRRKPGSISEFVRPSLSRNSDVISCIWKVKNDSNRTGAGIVDGDSTWIALAWFQRYEGSALHQVAYRYVGASGDVIAAYAMSVDHREGPRSWSFRSAFSSQTATTTNPKPCVDSSPEITSLGVPGSNNPYPNASSPLTGSYTRSSDGRTFAVTGGYFYGSWLDQAGCEGGTSGREEYEYPTTGLNLDAKQTVIAGRRAPSPTNLSFEKTQDQLLSGQALWPVWSETYLADPQSSAGRISPLRQVGRAGSSSDEVKGGDFYKGPNALIRSRDDFGAQRALESPSFGPANSDLGETRDVMPRPVAALPAVAGELAVYSRQQAMTPMRDPAPGEEGGAPMMDASGEVATPRAWYDAWLVPSRDKNSPALLSGSAEYQSGRWSATLPSGQSQQPHPYAPAAPCDGRAQGAICITSSGDLRRWDSDGRLPLAPTSGHQLLATKQLLYPFDESVDSYFHATLTTSGLPAGDIKNLSIYTASEQGEYLAGTPWHRVRAPISNRRGVSGWHIYRCRSGYDGDSLVARYDTDDSPRNQFRTPATVNYDGSTKSGHNRGADVADPGCEAPYFSWTWEHQPWQTFNAGDARCSTTRPSTSPDTWIDNLAEGQPDRQAYKDKWGGDPQVRGAAPWQADGSGANAGDANRCWVVYRGVDGASLPLTAGGGWRVGDWFYPGNTAGNGGYDFNELPGQGAAPVAGSTWLWGWNGIPAHDRADGSFGASFCHGNPSWRSDQAYSSAYGPTRYAWEYPNNGQQNSSNPAWSCMTQGLGGANYQIRGPVGEVVAGWHYRYKDKATCSVWQSWTTQSTAGTNYCAGTRQSLVRPDASGACPVAYGGSGTTGRGPDGVSYPDMSSTLGGAACAVWTNGRRDGHWYRNSPEWRWLNTNPELRSGYFPTDPALRSNPPSQSAITSLNFYCRDSSPQSIPGAPPHGDRGGPEGGQWDANSYYRARTGQSGNWGEGITGADGRTWLTGTPGANRRCDYYVPGWLTTAGGKWTGGLEESRQGPGFSSLDRNSQAAKDNKRLDPGAYIIAADVQTAKSTAAGARWRIESRQMNPNGSAWDWEIKTANVEVPTEIYSLGAQPTN